VRRLIVNADDFGLSLGINHGIVEAHQQGVVTSTTLMASAPAFAEAVRLAKTVETLSVGCHVVLLDGPSLLPPRKIFSLIARGDIGQDFGGTFHGVFEFAASAVRGRIKPEHIEAEAVAQMRRILSTGISLSHFDTHKHTHLLPFVLKPLLRAARECGVRALRNPFGPLMPLAFAHLRRPRMFGQYTELRGFRELYALFRRVVESEGLVTTDGTLAVVSPRPMDGSMFRSLMRCLPEGTWELVCHPGYCDDELRGLRTRLRESREQELRVLKSSAAREAVEENGISLIGYNDLAREADLARAANRVQ
jgi:predicted glycoside hydrolase/deacetylase ChbG (UPF0249 family)